MIILDTNVVSALMSAAPAPEVVRWISARRIETLFTTSICQAEILAGLAIMPEGRRRTSLESAANDMFAEEFAGRILSFDSQAAAEYAKLFAARRAAGRPASLPDLMIATIARSNRAAIATRDIGGFEGCGVELDDPWIQS